MQEHRSADVISAPKIPNPRFHESATKKVKTFFLVENRFNFKKLCVVLRSFKVNSIENGFIKFIKS